MINLIPRLYDVTGGEVKFDGIDVRKLDLAWLRSNIGIVSQETYLFNGTIRDNLLYAKPDATEEDIKKEIPDITSAQLELILKLTGELQTSITKGEITAENITLIID